MPAQHVVISSWIWGGFVLFILAMLALDLGLFNRGARLISFRQSLFWTIGWVCLAAVFAVGVGCWLGRRAGVEFATGYLLEFSLSLDNVFAIALVFGYFQVPAEYRHRVLFWGVIGALIMRGLMIGVGVALIERFDWALYVLGALLLGSGIWMLVRRDESINPERSWITRLARRLLPFSDTLDGARFLTRVPASQALIPGFPWLFTPLFLVLIVVESMDLLFAVDSIPAIFGVTRNAFIVFTSNMLAILGLRSMYFMLAGAMDAFRFLKYGVALVLVFIGVKMSIDPHDRPPMWFQYDLPDGASLLVVVGIIAMAILISLAVPKSAPPARKKGAA